MLYEVITGDTIEGEIRAPDNEERYFALVDVSATNFEDPERARHKIAFDNLTPLYPDERLRLDTLDPTVKDKSARRAKSSGKGREAGTFVV